MRLLFLFLLLASKPLFAQPNPQARKAYSANHNSQPKITISKMNDEQKKAFILSYEIINALIIKNPLMPKLWTNAQERIWKESGKVYLSLKNEAEAEAEADNKFTAQTVAYTKAMPDPETSPDPDDDDPNTIKKKEFIPYTLELLSGFQKNSQKLVGDERPISIASITTYLPKVMTAKTPLGKELKTKFEAVINDENNTVSKLAVAFSDIVKTYDNNTLAAHYKENKAAYLEKKTKKNCGLITFLQTYPQTPVLSQPPLLLMKRKMLTLIYL